MNKRKGIKHSTYEWEKAKYSWVKRSNWDQIMMVEEKNKLVIQLVIWKVEWLWLYELVIGTKGGDS